MESINYYKEFERIIVAMFRQLSYDVIIGGRDKESVKEIDLIAHGKDKYYAEIKFYRSVNISGNTIELIANDLTFYTQDKNDGVGLIIINRDVPVNLKQRIVEKFGILIWDRPELSDRLSQVSVDLYSRFEELLVSAQQGTNVYERTPNWGFGVRDYLYGPVIIQDKDKAQEFKKAQRPKRVGENFKHVLKSISRGRSQWVRYENTMVDVLRFLFDEDLSFWDQQPRTDDNLSRFDLVCRINAFDDYWKALITAFNSRFVLFEFKNYTKKVTQHQVYSTERYLYRNALRSVGFIISRNGPDASATQAAKGALKENGKLIMFLTDHDINTMLDWKDQKRNPSDYLADQLDLWLAGISR